MQMATVPLSVASSLEPCGPPFPALHLRGGTGGPHALLTQRQTGQSVSVTLQQSFDIILPYVTFVYVSLGQAVCLPEFPPLH